MKYSNTDVLVAEMKNLEFDHNHEGDVQRCCLCWETHCNHELDTMTDPFLSMSEDLTINELLYA